MKLKIGKTSYKVQMVDALTPKLSRGRITYKPVNTIQITRRANGRERSAKAKRHTFWHEAVHGMLYEMNSSKYRDEAFVDELAKLIQQVLSQHTGAVFNPVPVFVIAEKGAYDIPR